MGPGHTAELDSFKHIWKLFGTIDFHKLDCHPVRATGTQTISKIFTVFTECIAYGTQEKSNRDGDTVAGPAHCPALSHNAAIHGGRMW